MKNLILFALSWLLICSYGCKKDEPDPLEALTADLTTGNWFISELSVDNNELTNQYEQYMLTFMLEKDTESPQEIFNKLILSDIRSPFSGTWTFMAAGPEEDFENFLSIAFVNNSEFHSISARWGIKSHSKGKVELIKQADELSPDTRVIVLEKL